jgi:hypothetical protein
MTTTNRLHDDHSKCLHPATKAGRTACRKAGGPRGYAYKVMNDARTSGEALCADCFANALTSAFENIQDQIIADEGITWDELDARLRADLTADAIFNARAYRAARSYLYDQGALSACTAHEDLL